MIIRVIHNNYNYKINTRNSFDISIPYNFNGSQPNFFDVDAGKLKYFESNKKVYSVNKGSGCNVPVITMNIHCSGTHTEYVGHLLENPGDIGGALKDILIPSILITLNPELFDINRDLYHCSINKNEKIISTDSIKKIFDNWKIYKPKGLIIRTIPNIDKKKYYCYSDNIPPFFSNDAIRFIKEIGIDHLVVDIPSIDRMDDNGILGNHRIFWSDDNEIKSKLNFDSTSTITEMAFIPNNILDGFYFLNIQIPHFVCDAAPSRPILLKTD